MATIFHEDDGDVAVIQRSSIAVVGYGNQGRSWALNLRDSGLDVKVCARADESRRQAETEGFPAHEIPEANDADVICVLVPDDVIAELPLAPRRGALVVVASGYTPAFGRFEPECDLGMVAPRMLGPEVRRCYEEGVGFITAVGVHRDHSGNAWDRTLAVAKAIGGLRQGAIELTARQEAILDLAVEQALSPALTRVSEAFVTEMTERGIPLAAVLVELVLSGEVERTYRLLREEGFAGQLEYHSPTSQYGQLSRRGAYDHLDVGATMHELVEQIADGRFADEWDAERATGHAKLKALKEQHAGPAIAEFERAIREQLGSGGT